MLLTDLLAKLTEGNLELSRSWYTCCPRSWRTLSTLSFLCSAVVFDFCLLMLIAHCFLAAGLHCDLPGCSLLSFRRLLLLSYQLLVLRGPLLPGELLRELGDQREVLAVDAHLPLDRLHAPLLREVEAQPPQPLADRVPDLGLYLGPVRDVLLPDRLVGDLRRADVGDDGDRRLVGDVVPPPVDLLIEDLERDVAALVIQQGYPVGEP